MEWWQHLLSYSFFTLLVLVFGYLLNQRGSRHERQAIERSRLIGAVRGLLGELEANQKLAEKEWTGRLTPFLTDMWAVHRGDITSLPRSLQEAVHQSYIEIGMANALVDLNLYQLEYGAGYLHEPYKEECKKIASISKEAILELERWLQQTEK